MAATHLSLRPHISEKTYALAQTSQTYVFDVPMTANKQLVKDAVAAQYKVTVTDVRLAIAKGKLKKAYQRSGKTISGRRNDVKKAYVTLKKGESITVFEEAA